MIYNPVFPHYINGALQHSYYINNFFSVDTVLQLFLIIAPTSGH